MPSAREHRRRAAFLAALAATTFACAQEARGPGGPGGPKQPIPELPATGEVDVVLGRPSAQTITLSVRCYAQAGELLVTYRPNPPSGVENVRPFTCTRERASEIRLEDLRADTPYAYTITTRRNQPPLIGGSFHTARPPGSTFVFTLTADSHLDGNTDIALYQRTLTNASHDAPDFHIDLGDTFMTDKHADRAAAAVQYRAQRAHLATLGAAAPLFLVLGNHDGEDRRFRQEAEGLAA